MSRLTNSVAFALAYFGAVGSSHLACKAEVFNAESLPQIPDLTEFDIKAVANDPKCASTSLTFVDSSKFIQVCDRAAVAGRQSRTAVPSRKLSDKVVAPPSAFLRKGGDLGAKTGDDEEKPDGGDVEEKPDEGNPDGGDGGNIDGDGNLPDPPVIPEAAESYIQLVDKEKFLVVKRVVAADSTTVFQSATAMNESILLVSLKASKEIKVYSLKTLEPATIDVAGTAVGTIPLDIIPRGIFWDQTLKKLYATDGSTNKIYVYSDAFTQDKSIDVICGKDGMGTNHLAALTYVKPYLYTTIDGTSNVIRVDMALGTCDKTWLMDFAKEASDEDDFVETNKLLTSVTMDTTTTEYTGPSFPTMVVGGKEWTHNYELSGAATYIVNSFILFALTAVTSVFSA